jgi:hypothetical protein
MDLVTLVTACALTVEPRIMHALVWQQSGGEPWSFSLPGESQPRAYSTLQDAVREARIADGTRIHVGLAGLSIAPRSATAATFAPCSNIGAAARRIVQLSERCKTLPRFKTDPLYCAIAVYRGSWDRPDAKFAEAVRETVEKDNAPNFDMPKDAFSDPAEVAETPAPGPGATPPAPAPASDDRELGWSSALFPAKPPQPDSASADAPNHGRSAEQSLSSASASAIPASTKATAESLFVARSSERRP